MTAWSMRFDMRMPDFLTTTAAEQYRAALELSGYADAHGCSSIMVSEHHQSEDGYLPDALMMAMAIAAVTKKAMLAIGALILPLHDPIRAAERTAMLDIVSNGRVVVIVGGGYVAREFAMFGLDVHDRARLMEEKLPVYLAALSGEPFEHLGVTVRVTPRSVQRPRPMVLARRHRARRGPPRRASRGRVQSDRRRSVARADLSGRVRRARSGAGDRHGRWRGPARPLHRRRRRR